MDGLVIELLSSNTNSIISLCVIIAVLVLYIEFVRSNKTSSANVGNKESPKERGSTSQSTGVIRRPTGPRSYPIIGNLACFRGYEIPYQAYDDLAKKYGPIISLRMGSTPAVVVNGINNVKEVLITKSSHFFNRPNLFRIQIMYGANIKYSLFFGNLTDFYKLHRKMAYHHTIPQKFLSRFHDLNEIVKTQMQMMISDIEMKRRSIGSTDGTGFDVKPIILRACGNIYTKYFSSRDFSTKNAKFQQWVQKVDSVFREFDQVYAADFLPFLLPLHGKNLKRFEKCLCEVKDFILENIIQDRREKWTEYNDVQLDYVDSLIDHVQRDAKPNMEWEIVMQTLIEIFGTFPGIGNLLMKIFGFIGAMPEVQQKIQTEIDGRADEKTSTGQSISIDLLDLNRMPYTEAVILESLRLISTPIIPHVANQTTSIGGYLIEKNSVIFLNNYNLNMSPELWDEPMAFKPERFIQNGRIVKPEHFIPFGTGKRSCLGAKLAPLITFSILANCMQNFSIHPPPNVTHKITIGLLAVPEKSYEMIFIERNK